MEILIYFIGYIYIGILIFGIIQGINKNEADDSVGFYIFLWPLVLLMIIFYIPGKLFYITGKWFGSFLKKFLNE